MRSFQHYPFRSESHAASLPALAAGEERAPHAVAIVGGGISGLTCALALAAQGIRSVVLEADESVCVGSRAICFSRRSLEILSRLGALAPFLRTGLPWTGGRSFYRNAEVLRFSMPHDALQRLPPMINLQQYYAEQFLLEAVEASGRVQVRWQTRVRGIEPRADGVRLELDTPLGAYALQALWVIGCDGARSLVREAAALPLQGTRYEGRYVIVDLALKSERPVERLAWFDPPSNPGSTILMHRQPEDVWRIDYQLREDEDPDEAVRPERVIPRVESHLKMIGERDDWAPIWVSLYRANALTAASYRRARLLIVGDAAHLVPIFGVRGANSAFEDADNLAWKLALVLRGAAPESLLDTYSHERVAAAQENLRQSAKSTEFMSPPGYGFELMRTAVLGLAVEHAFVRALINPRQTQAIGYPASALNGPSVGAFGAGPAPGEVALECPLRIAGAGAARDGHLTEHFTPHFIALCFGSGAAAHEWAELERLLERSGIFLRSIMLAPEQAGQAFERYGAQPGCVYLIRPDGYVAARWQQGSPASVAAALGRLLCGQTRCAVGGAQ